MKEEERKRKAAEKEETKAQERSQRVSTQTRKRKAAPSSSEAGPSEAGPSEAGPSSSSAVPTRSNLRSQGGTGPSSSKAPRLDELIVANQCCVCYQAFDQDVEMEAGTEWVQCVCTRWPHEDCVIDCVIDDSGKEKLCPHCIIV